MDRILILSAKGWDFVKEDTGEAMSGDSVEFVNCEYSNDDPACGPLGAVPMRMSLHHARTGKLPSIPGIYKVQSTMMPDPKTRKPTLTVTKAELVGPINLTQIADNLNGTKK